MALNSLGNAGELVALNAAAGITPAQNLYIALFTIAPAADGTGGAEVADANGYTRKQVTFTSAATSDGVSPNPSPAGIGFTKNSANVIFDIATGSWGTIEGIGIYDSETYGAGNLYWYGELATAKTVGTDDQLRFLTGSIVLTMD